MENRIEGLARELRAYEGPPIRVMEVCGTHTHQISRFGIASLLPPDIALISGPGCPVCVTPAGYIDRAADLSMRPGCTLLTFGDMIRVPGQRTSLLKAKAEGGGVQMMYSPMDALRHAKSEPDRLFFVTAVGFETTLPLYALLLQRMREENVRNIRLLPAVKALVPALRWICQNSPDIDGFLGPGHVSAILGARAYEPVCGQYGIPMAIAGFSYEHLILSLVDLVRQIRRGTCQVHNLYKSAVSEEGNTEALQLIDRYFVREPSVWRGLGEIADSGYRLAPAYAEYGAELTEGAEEGPEPAGCLCGRVIIGRARPVDCAFFGSRCTPEAPLGPCMVSSEGTCGIWHATARAR